MEFRRLYRVAYAVVLSFLPIILFKKMAKFLGIYLYLPMNLNLMNDLPGSPSLPYDPTSTAKNLQLASAMANKTIEWKSL